MSFVLHTIHGLPSTTPHCHQRPLHQICHRLKKITTKNECPQHPINLRFVRVSGLFAPGSLLESTKRAPQVLSSFSVGFDFPANIFICPNSISADSLMQPLFSPTLHSNTLKRRVCTRRGAYCTRRSPTHIRKSHDASGYRCHSSAVRNSSVIHYNYDSVHI